MCVCMCVFMCVCGQEGMGAQLGLRRCEGVEDSFVCLQCVRKTETELEQQKTQRRMQSHFKAFCS